MNIAYSKLSVTFCAYDFSEGRIGGPLTWLARLVPGLLREGIFVRVILATMLENAENGYLHRRLRDSGVDVSSFYFTTDLRTSAHNFLKHFWNRPTGVFVPNLAVGAYVASRYLRDCGIKTVGVLHSDDKFHQGLLETFGTEPFNVDRFVCVSKLLLKVAKKRGISGEQLSLIPYGAPLPAAAARKSGKSFTVIYAGRLEEEQKRIRQVLEAFIDCENAIPQFQGELYGSGSKTAQLQERLQEAGSKSVKLMGAVSPEEIQDRIVDGQVFLLLSAYEGLPIALMEAMACGLVPIVRRIRSGIDELVIDGETGFVIDDDTQVLQKVQKLIADPELWRRLSTNARAHIRQSFTVEVGIERWAQLIRELNGTISHPTQTTQLTLPPRNAKLRREDNRFTKPKIITDFGNRILNKLEHASGTRKPHDSRHDGFTSISKAPYFIDLYVHRLAVLSALRDSMPKLNGRLLDIGCGKMPYREMILKESAVSEYTGLDIETAISYDRSVKPDFTWDGKTMPFEDNSFDCAMATEVLEHCAEPEVLLAEARRVLKPGGVLFLTVPFLWNLHETPHDEYRYTPFSLVRHLKNSGFEDITIKALGGWHAALAQMIGLWVRRAPIRRELRLIFSLLATPCVRFLLWKDAKSNIQFTEGQMISGLTALAKIPKQ